MKPLLPCRAIGLSFRGFGIRQLILAGAVLITAGFSLDSQSASTTHLGVPPEDLVQLKWSCNQGNPERIHINGDRETDFAIPRNHSLVLTDLEWWTTAPAVGIGQNYILEIKLKSAGGFVSTIYGGFMQYTQHRASKSEHLTAGIALDDSVSLVNDIFTPGPVLSLFGVSPGSGQSVGCHAVLRGYLLDQKKPEKLNTISPN